MYYAMVYLCPKAMFCVLIDLPVQVVLNEPISKKDGSTLLHIGSTSGHPTIVRNLLSAGADPTVR